MRRNHHHLTNAPSIFHLALISDKRNIHLFQIISDTGDKTAFFLNQIIKKPKDLLSMKNEYCQ